MIVHINNIIRRIKSTPNWSRSDGLHAWRIGQGSEKIVLLDGDAKGGKRKCNNKKCFDFSCTILLDQVSFRIHCLLYKWSIVLHVFCFRNVFHIHLWHKTSSTTTWRTQKSSQEASNATWGKSGQHSNSSDYCISIIFKLYKTNNEVVLLFKEVGYFHNIIIHLLLLLLTWDSLVVEWGIDLPNKWYEYDDNNYRIIIIQSTHKTWTASRISIN